MKIQLFWILGIVTSASADDPLQSSPEWKICEDFKATRSYDKLIKATRKDTCSVTCSFYTYDFSDPQPRPEEVPGVSVQPVVSKVNGTTEDVDVADNQLQPCGEGKICVYGVCTPEIPNLSPECVENVGNESVAIEGVNKCLIKCVRLDETEAKLSVFTTNIPLPDKTPCGDKRMCSGRDCLSSSSFAGVC